MVVNLLELNNFRNYSTLKLELDSHNNILCGDNAQGKTNILESVYMCGTTRSHKGSKDKEVIRLGENEAHIRMVVEKNNTTRRIDMHLRKNRAKGVAIDGIPIKKSLELFGLINLVFFSPEDLTVIKNGPSERRRFIDMELCQLDKLYLYNLSKYNKIIIQRNNLLKQIGHNKELIDTLDIWDEQLVTYGKDIIKKRTQFIKELNEIVLKIHEKLSGNLERLKISYEPSCSFELFADKLKKVRDRDIFVGMTSVGPHRDDMSFFINDIDVRKFGSQGQQRTSALSLKLAEIELVKQNIKDSPVLLLDDVLSELDRKRQTYLLNSISNIQTIVTCTGLEEFIKNRFDIDNIYKVVNGKIYKE